MEDSVAFSSDSEDSILASSKLDSKDASLMSQTPVISKQSTMKHNPGGGHDKLAELFRKDLISAMKLPDTESLQPEDYHQISDPWRQDWERGVQVPINPDDFKHGSIVIIKENEHLHGPYSFKIPKKYLHAVQDETYKQGVHELHGMQALADDICRYDLDELDCRWLDQYNELRTQWGNAPLDEWMMERVMESMETRCYDGMQEAMKTVEGLGIEYDEDIVCDICRSPEVEEGNEMVFCDGCDICVHQACYGILKVPKGNWLCKTCVLNIKPSCVLCPKSGGAMKLAEDGLRWAHLSCAIWIPEVTIGCSEKMQPIKNIEEIPATRWALICTLCRERKGACIQCCVKKCKTAFHITCAFEHGLEMKVNLEDDDSDVQLKGYCAVHSKKHDVEGTSPKRTPTSTPRKPNEMTEEEKTAQRSQRLKKLAEEFFLYVDRKAVASHLELDLPTVDFIFQFWVLKRKSNFNKPLLTPKVEEGDILLRQQEDTMVARLKMFIHLRQDLERVRNLCYMVMKREKIRGQLHRVKMQLFLEQSKILRKEKLRPNGREYKHICTAHRQNMTIYDDPEKALNTSKYYESVADSNETDDETKKPSQTSKKKTITTPVKAKKQRTPTTDNPYAKPTYKSFAWMLSSRRRKQADETGSPEEEQLKVSVERRQSHQKRKGRRLRMSFGLESNANGVEASSASDKLVDVNETAVSCEIDKDGCVMDENVRFNSACDKFKNEAQDVLPKTEFVKECAAGGIGLPVKKRRGRPPRPKPVVNTEGIIRIKTESEMSAPVDAHQNTRLESQTIESKENETKLFDCSKESCCPEEISNSEPSTEVGFESQRHDVADGSGDKSPKPIDKLNGRITVSCEQLNVCGTSYYDGICDNNLKERLPTTGLVLQEEDNDLIADCKMHVNEPCKTESVDDNFATSCSADNGVNDELVVETDSVKTAPNSSRNLPVNGRTRGSAHGSRKRRSIAINGKSDEDRTSESGSRRMPRPGHLKENGVLKTQSTLDRFVKRLKRVTDQMKQNGSLSEKPLPCSQAYLNGEPENQESTEIAMEDFVRALSPVSSADELSNLAKRSNSPSQTLTPNTPSRKRSSRVGVESNGPAVKRLRSSRDEEPVTRTGEEPVTRTDDESMMRTDDDQLSPRDLKKVNGSFSPVAQRRYPTRQSLVTS